MEKTLKVVDYFVVCGLNEELGLEPDQLSGDNLDSSPLDRPYKCHVLFHLPEKNEGFPFDAEAVAMLCFPRGLSFTTDSLQKPFTHSFIMTRVDGSRSYGTVVTFMEEVRCQEICLAMQILQDMHMTELSNTQSLTLNRQRNKKKMLLPEETHLRSRSRDTLPRREPLELSFETPTPMEWPQLKPQRLVYRRDKDTLFCSKSICLISRLPLVDAQQRMLFSLLDLLRKSNPPVPIPSYIFHYLFQLEPLPPGKSMKIHSSNGFISTFRPGPQHLPLLDYPLKELFSWFGVKKVVNILTCLLLELQVLICSKEYKKLMLVAECLTSLLFPFHWQHTYVPILPASLLHFLDAPVPFIMGLCVKGTLEAHQLFENSSRVNSCLVDVDRQETQFPEELPSFPYLSSLIEDLEFEIRRFKNYEKSLMTCRDSGIARESFSEEVDNSAHSSSFSSDWTLKAKMEMLQKNETLSRLTTLAQESGVLHSMEDIKNSLTDAAINKHRVVLPKPSLDTHSRDLLFNSGIREVFLYYFLQIFKSYESFVIYDNATDVQSWLSNRDTTQNFDKTAFLSDQSEEVLPFLAPFIETQMFASFIDQKILTKIEASGSSSATAWTPATWRDRECLLIFESRLSTLKLDQQNSSDQRLKNFYRTKEAKEVESQIEKKMMNNDICSASPRDLYIPCPHALNFFPSLPQDCFQHLIKEHSLFSQKGKSSIESWRNKYELSGRVLDQKNILFRKQKYLDEVNSKAPQISVPQQEKLSDLKGNWKLMETLLKEVKTKTKRMLVQKMGKEAVELGHGEATRAGIEENTSIASLCDLLERIWNYGLIKKQDKSSLWHHLSSFYQASHPPIQEIDSSIIPSSIIIFDPSSTSCISSTSCSTSSEGNFTWPSRHHRRSSSRGFDLPSLQPLPSSVTFDYKNVLQMTEIKTSVGLARAFVRLSLEKKLLSKHLKELFSNQDLLRKLYKKYAFLRCEDEREQFLYHLLSLNAVDYFCFTNSFINTIMSYRVLIFPRVKMGGATTTANCWIRLSGQIGTTENIPLPKHSLDVTIKHKNLGVLTTMRVGHDNSGLSAKWLVEYIIVRNEITAHTYKFTCGRWLGRGVDDGALERLLVAENIPSTIDSNELIERCRTPPRCRSPSASGKRIEPRINGDDIREKLRDAVNNLVKHFCKVEKERGSTTILLCGEGGLVPSLELIFQYGFKSARLFRNKFFIWDFLEKVVTCYECILLNKDYKISYEIETCMKSFCYVLSKINRESEDIGKDERFQILVCFGLRDKLLSRWVKLTSKSPVTSSMYEEHSFLRNPSKLKVVIDLLESLTDFDILLENSIIRGITL